MTSHRKAANILDQFAELKSDYNISKPSRYKTKKRGMMTLGSHADYHYRSAQAYYGAMELAREMCRNNPLVMQGVRRLIANVVGRGFVLDADSGDPGIDAVNGYRWEEWSQHAEQCDDQQEMDFHQLEHLTLQQVIIDGDMCSLPNVDGGIESQEAHRLKTPNNTRKNVVHGVELDDRRRRLRYWFTNEDVSPMTPVSRVGDVTQMDARDQDGRRQILHHYLPDRRSQTRGVTAFAPMADTADHWDDLQFAQLVGAKIQSCYTILRELQSNAPALPPMGDGDHSETTEQRPDGQTRTLTDVAPGFEVYGWPGESLKGFTPTIPGQQFFQHSKLLLAILAVNLDLPLVVFMLDASETNYSGFRGAIDQARQRWREIQNWYQGSFHRPIYEWKVRQWATRDATLRRAIERADQVRSSLGYIPANEVNPFAHTWHAQELPYIQPVDDATADILQSKGLLSSPRRIAASRGQDYEDLTNEIVDDHALRIRLAHEKAQQLNEELDLDPPLHWREILSWPMPDGVQVMATQPKPPPEPANGNGDNQTTNGQNRVAELLKNTRGIHVQ